MNCANSYVHVYWISYISIITLLYNSTVEYMMYNVLQTVNINIYYIAKKSYN